MAPVPRRTTPPSVVENFNVYSQERLTLLEIFPRHRNYLSALPGETSQFHQSNIGYEWRCEFQITPNRADDSPAARHDSLHLHFSLIDLEGYTRPAAVLSLISQGQLSEEFSRHVLPTEDMEQLPEQLNQLLSNSGAEIQEHERAAHFLAALSKLRESLGSEVLWS
ncbi:MAG: hypothetical protein V7754_06215 [Halioglobus sp.]